MTSSWTTAGVDLHVETNGSGQRASLEDSLRTAIQTRRLAAGTLLPSTRALAADLGIARGTVVAAYDQLVAEGYLLARQGAGTQVADLGPALEPATEARRRSATRLDLRPGTPDVAAFPVSAWLRSTRRALTAASATAFGYGDVRGRRELRSALVDYLGRTRGVHATIDQVMITAGATHALSLLCTALTAAGSTTMAMENPGFAMHRPVVRLAGQRIVGVPVDALGAVTSRLAEVGADDAGALVVTPAHQYPIGVTMHPARRHALTAWARGRGGLVIEDDYDGEYRYGRQPIGSLQGTAPDHVAYLGTASKTLAPGLRIGWLVLPHRWIEPLVEIKRCTDLAAPTITQLTLADMITTHGYDRQVRTMRLRYRRRRDLLTEAMAQVGPGLVTGIPAGLQAPVLLPANGPSEDEVISTAAAEGLALEGLSRHYFDDAPHNPGLLIGFSKPTERAYPAAIALL
ncbi:MAG TPA: PLP-dependent aminotransferase family protein, partial [Jatrophihabitans sp.]|nr:PLP-dependent aminotransferase family protein [Jatrophihabitans sp.]